MKLHTIFIISLLLFSAPALAQEDADAGVTPDSILWGIDVALEKIGLALTFDNKARAEKGLNIAEERLQEIKVMATEKKIKAMAKAESEHGKIITKIKEDIEKVEVDDPTEEVKTVIKLEQKIGSHEANMEEVRQNIDIKIRGELTEEQQALIDTLLSNLENQTGELKIKIINKKDKTKIKIKVKTGKSEVEIEQEVEGYEEEVGLTRDRSVWAQKAIDHAEEKIAKAEEKIAEKIADGLNATVAEDFLAQAKDTLAQAKDTLNAMGYREARKLAQEAGKLAMHAKRGKSFEKIKVECVTDADCKEGKMCVEGKCKKVERPECVVNADCKADEVCVDEECEKKPECTVDADCKEVEICVEGECEEVEVPATVEEPECSIDADCKENETCIEGKCEKKGTLVLLITDAPPELNITKVLVNISNVTVHKANATNETGWFTVVEEAQTFDLIEIEDVQEFLGSEELGAGKYTQMRLNVDAALATIDGVEYDLKIPSKTIKLVKPFIIESGETTTLTLDFDAQESIHVAGEDKYIMKPTIKIIQE